MVLEEIPSELATISQGEDLTSRKAKNGDLRKLTLDLLNGTLTPQAERG